MRRHNGGRREVLLTRVGLYCFQGSIIERRENLYFENCIKNAGASSKHAKAEEHYAAREHQQREHHDPTRESRQARNREHWHGTKEGHA